MVPSTGAATENARLRALIEEASLAQQKDFVMRYDKEMRQSLVRRSGTILHNRNSDSEEEPKKKGDTLLGGRGLMYG